MTVWVLCLNDMRSPKIEILTPIIRADSKEKLLSFMESQACPPYSDGRWQKSFKQGGPLEWFNPPWDFERDRHFVDVGTANLAAERARTSWMDSVLRIQEV